MTRWKSVFVGIASIMLLIMLSGCVTVSYYTQSVVGHSRLMLARQAVDEVIGQTSSLELKHQLELSKRLKVFAEQSLGLPRSDSYSHYVALERDYPVWNVVAAPEFSVVPKQWCYLVIGCAVYRGYFAEDAAHEYAASLEQQGFETVVGGATAYSTLGWFADPILPSMLRYGDTQFAETLFHELAHQKLYINGDSEFNEAFASVIGEVGTERWLMQNNPTELAKYRDQLAAIDQFHQLLSGTKDRLAELYERALSVEQLRAAKAALLTNMHRDYTAMRDSAWDGYGWFDRWFETPVNNARLAAFSTYRDKLPALRALLTACEHDLNRFYDVVSEWPVGKAGIELPNSCKPSK